MGVPYNGTRVQGNPVIWLVLHGGSWVATSKVLNAANTMLTMMFRATHAPSSAPERSPRLLETGPSQSLEQFSPGR